MHKFAIINRVQEQARAILPTLTRSAYADDVVAGVQEWSGADLKGKARKFGASYAAARKKARTAVARAGGIVHPCGSHGRLLLCVPVGQDEWGNAIYQTECGPAVAGASIRLSMLP